MLLCKNCGERKPLPNSLLCAQCLYAERIEGRDDRPVETPRPHILGGRPRLGSSLWETIAGAGRVDEEGIWHPDEAGTERLARLGRAYVRQAWRNPAERRKLTARKFLESPEADRLLHGLDRAMRDDFARIWEILQGHIERRRPEILAAVILDDLYAMYGKPLFWRDLQPRLGSNWEFKRYLENRELILKELREKRLATLQLPTAIFMFRDKSGVRP